jgi:hypothetical protein
MSPQEFIERAIHEAFDELAELAGEMEMTEDEAAGVPFQLFAKEQELLAAWRKITGAQA